ncbi:hypothetical protein P7D22_14715 [Lichenihabitans sp. Uapishka_5]|uniref:hypothetical protein n=1 Tax=Lichenihabitans sp. Uapishka_5 TaxID=3037302 RepID=UPI0029E81FBC|nr:hypothetical protein [Lichenihabitans sp. Uapishka_5]MDX7952421.1 hypothetical protein [Lichenihabitans sp. Uapishka_5]
MQAWLGGSIRTCAFRSAPSGHGFEGPSVFRRRVIGPPIPSVFASNADDCTPDTKGDEQVRVFLDGFAYACHDRTQCVRECSRMAVSLVAIYESKLLMLRTDAAHEAGQKAAAQEDAASNSADVGKPSPSATASVSTPKPGLTRSGPKRVGYDAFCIIVVDMPNDGSPVVLVESEPAPALADIYAYQSMIDRLTHTYATKFKDL